MCIRVGFVVSGSPYMTGLNMEVEIGRTNKDLIAACQNIFVSD